MSYNILLVEDDSFSRVVVKELLKDHFSNITLYEADSSTSCIEILKSNQIHIAILDFYLPDVTDFELIHTVKNISNKTYIIMLTAMNDVPKIVQAIKFGARDYVLKENAQSLLPISIQRCIDDFKDEELKMAYIEEISTRNSSKIFIPDHQVYCDIYRRALAFAKTELNILILGETGTGKEVMAHFIHSESKRPGPLITLDCASIPASILESELFGHEKGAFTDAYAEKPGKIELANKGTLFLDEVGNIPFNIQAKLLRVLETKQIERVGGTEAKQIDFRLIAATNDNLQKSAQEGAFRMDLMYRINQGVLKLPCLRQHSEVIPLFLDYFIQLYNHKYQVKYAPPQELMQHYLSYDWPGNIRELKNEIFKETSLFSVHYQSKEIKTIPDNKENSLKNNMATIEKINIEKALIAQQYNISKTAQELGIKRTTLQFKIKKLGIIIKK